MSVWRRIGEALSAVARGEGLGAVFERLRAPPERSVAFTIAVIALAAKMAKADGRVTRDEIRAFHRIFIIPPGEERAVGRVYDLARGDVAGFEHYARRVARMFRRRPRALADVLEGLVYIAAADGRLDPAESTLLDRAAEIFGIDAAEYRAIRARYLPGERDPWKILGLAPGASRKEVRRRYRALVRRLHPDRMIARGAPEEARRLAEERLAAITAAYGEILQQLEAAEAARACASADQPRR